MFLDRVGPSLPLLTLTCTVTTTVGDGDDAHYDLYAPAMMQTASFYQPPLATTPTSNAPMGDSTRASVNHLLAGACSTPCSTAAQTFVQIVPPLSRFQLALDVLMPMLDAPIEVSSRLLVIMRCAAHTPRVSIADPTHTRVLYIVLTLRAAPDFH